MIITSLTTGLGNQMFQYAIGKHLAVINGTELTLDVSAVEKHNPHGTRLDVFNISAIPLSRSEEKSLRFYDKTRLSKILLHSYKHVYEKDRHFDPSILQLKGNIILHGYWQSENYFKEIRERLLKEFTVKNELNDQNKSMLENIMNSNSVCVHVRRGDYVADKNINAFHGTCTLEYYQKAVKCLEKQIEKPNIFIFSDDPAWIQNNLRFEHPTTYVTINNNIKAYEDIRLMSNCKHFIIANSSFSWWGAWLSTNPEKLIFSPSKWLVNDSEGDIIPKSWLRVEA